MAVKVSTGLRSGLMVEGSFKTLMDSCTLKIYGGVEPVNADAAIGSGVLLCQIFNGNDGATTLTFEATAPNGILQKTSAEAWAGTCVATGTATYYRLELATDDQSASTTHKRLQGKVAVAGEDLSLTGSVALVQNAVQVLGFYSVVLPVE